MSSYVMAFLVGGLICGVGQLFLDFTNYTPGHLLVILVVTGSILTGIGVYPKLIELAGAGVSVLVMNFGYILTKGVLLEVNQDGLMGLLSGILEKASIGVSAAIIIGFLMAVIFKPKE